MASSSQKAFPVSWDQFHRDARALAWRLSGEGPFEAIVCITRGGLVPAAIVARELGTRLIETVCVASYLDYKNQSDLTVLKGVAPAVKALGDGQGRGVLVVDDLTDTGKTAKIVRDMLPNAHFATVYAKPAARPRGLRDHPGAPQHRRRARRHHRHRMGAGGLDAPHHRPGRASGEVASGAGAAAPFVN